LDSIILLPGALGTASQFDSLKEILHNNFNVYAPDYPGHGTQSMPAENFSIKFFQDYILSYMDQKSIHATYFFGYSMGGYIALSLASQHPEKVKGIITLATKFNWQNSMADAAAMLPDSKTISEKIPKLAARLQSDHIASDWKLLVDKTRMMLEKMNDEQLLEADFKNIKCNVQLLIGENDKIVSLHESEAVAAMLPNSSVQILIGVPHQLEPEGIRKSADVLLTLFS
jgi:pimeloyl-ACP methyl ester carboxylesterase